MRDCLSCLSRSARFCYGVELSFGSIVIYRAGSMRYNRSSSACQWGSIALPNEDLAGVARALVGRELNAPPVTHRIKPSPAALKQLLNLHEPAGHLAKTAPDILAKPDIGRAIDQALAEAMLACLTAYSADERGAYPSHARVMQRLEEVLRANPEGSLYGRFVQGDRRYLQAQWRALWP